MKRIFRSAISLVLKKTPLGLWPVRVKRGIAQGARWTLYPWTSYWRGNYEPPLQEALLALGNGDIRGWNCWDLGAHFGLYSVGLARRVGPTGQVAAFEPNPQSFLRLSRHQRMNRLGWLKVFPFAASDTSGAADLLTYGDLGTTTTHLAYEGETIDENAGALRIQSVSLDELVARGEVKEPQFIKIDVEGHGHRALKGMARTVAKARPVLIVGLHSACEAEGIHAVLDPLGYMRSSIQSQGEGHEARGDFLFTPAGAGRAGV